MIELLVVAFGPAGLAGSEDVVGSDHLKVRCTKSNPHTSFSDVDECISVIGNTCFYKVSKGSRQEFFGGLLLRYLPICFAFSCNMFCFTSQCFTLPRNTFALPRNTSLLPFLLRHMSISAQLLPAQRPSMDQLIEFYFELGIKYADIVLMLNRHGYVIENESKLKQILRSRSLSRRKQYGNLQDVVSFIREQLLYSDNCTDTDECILDVESMAHE